jgi:hypothetical protein
MDYAFFLICVSWNVTPMTVENIQKIESTIGHFGEWFRFNGSTWFFAGEVVEQTLYGAIKPQLTNNDFFVVAKFDPDHLAGWGPIDIDEWFKQRRQNLAS